MDHIKVLKNFYPESKKLREEFENYFRNPHSADAKRFVWDYWFIKNQYNLIRTPAYHYFSKKNYINFHSYLVQWGRENLGCHDISPPWLSYYVDGCFQNLHSDVPHGPWAFVYSLSPRNIKFTGGETLILKPQTLNYWNHFTEEKDREYLSFVDLIPSQFNQLTVFDPRYPHGVTEVKGVRDPLESRLVVHGWFVEPRPYVVGGLSTALTMKGLDPAFDLLNEELTSWPQLHGTLSLRLWVKASGQIAKSQFVTNTVKTLNGSLFEERQIHREIRRLFNSVQFPKAKKNSQITLPLLFK